MGSEKRNAVNKSRYNAPEELPPPSRKRLRGNSERKNFTIRCIAQTGAVGPRNTRHCEEAGDVNKLGGAPRVSGPEHAPRIDREAAWAGDGPHLRSGAGRRRR